jgi:hypothetical protein
MDRKNMKMRQDYKDFKANKNVSNKLQCKTKDKDRRSCKRRKMQPN